MGRILGVNNRSYPSEIHGYVRVTVVLVEGGANDYAAYQGEGEVEWVKAHGDKMPFEEACVHFPGGQLEESRYRL